MRDSLQDFESKWGLVLQLPAAAQERCPFSAWQPCLWQDLISWEIRL